MASDLRRLREIADDENADDHIRARARRALRAHMSAPAPEPGAHPTTYTCPLCRREIPARAAASHLETAHGH